MYITEYSVMLITENSTALCKAVEFFDTFYTTPDFSTLFLLRPVEKTVENVENSILLTFPAVY